jgi:glycosyltransferase involved in cell wall biosynthesis
MSVSVLTVSQGSRILFLEQLIKYLSSQLYGPIIEWIVVDGSKTVEYSAALQGYLGQLQNFRCTVVVSSWGRASGPLGLGGLRNMANNMAKGDYIAWMDDDDYYPPGYIAYAVSRLSMSHKRVAGCAIPYMYDTNYKTVNQFDLINENITMNSCLVYKKEYLLENAYDPGAMANEEIHFLRDFTEPMIQLDPMKTMLLIRHSDNVLNRSFLIHSSHAGMNQGLTLTRLQLSDLVADGTSLSFYEGPAICGPMNQSPYDIVYFCGAFSLPWTPDDTSLGGSEQAVVQLARQWTRMGKKVCVYGDLTVDKYVDSGIDYFHYKHFNPNQHFKTFIVWRYMGLSLMFTPQLHGYIADRLIVDLHDNLTQTYDIVAKNLDKIDRVIFKSRYHVDEFVASTGVVLPWSKTEVILNGIQTDVFRAGAGAGAGRQRYRFCYTSSYTRGLLEILDLWMEIVKVEPRAELHLYYGIPVVPGDVFYEAFVTAMRSSKNVCDHGRTPINIVAEEKWRSTFHLYPTNTNGEIDCIAIRESLVAGCIPILSRNRVFKERDGYFVQGDMVDRSNYPKMAIEIVELARDIARCDALCESLSRSKTICSWEDTAKEWLRIME